MLISYTGQKPFSPNSIITNCLDTIKDKDLVKFVTLFSLNDKTLSAYWGFYISSSGNWNRITKNPSNAIFLLFDNQYFKILNTSFSGGFWPKFDPVQYSFFPVFAPAGQMKMTER